MSNILIISGRPTLGHNLNTILTFLGESSTAIAFEQAVSTLKSHPVFDAVLIDALDMELAGELCDKFPQQPFILVDSKDANFTSGANRVGAVDEAVTYPLLTQMLHRCQEHRRMQPNRNTTPQNK